MFHPFKAVSGVALALSLVGVLTAFPVSAGEFMFMPTVAYIQTPKSVHEPNFEKQQYIGDLFYSADEGKLRFLGELQLDTGGADMERLQVGWRLTPETSLWF